MSEKNSHIIYRIPGMGADKRLFSEIEPIDGCKFVDIEWQSFPKIKTLKEYALEISKQIDCSNPFSLLGVSMGGMVCAELTDIVSPEKVVIISSAKCSKEIPPMYKRLNFLGITRILNSERIQAVLNKPNRYFGAMNKGQQKLFYEMANQVDLDFIAWSIKAILNWDKKIASEKIIHIHGTKDNVLPFKNVQSTIVIENGDHMMIWNKSSQINNLLKTIFS